MAQPLTGIRVVDFGHYIAGPAVGMMLADLGAEVVKVDPPEGPRWRAPLNAMLMRGKQQRTIDLKTAAGIGAARDLIATADVVIENFRPGTMARLGLGAAQLCREHDRLVWLSLPGFSALDRDRASLRAFEGIVCAAAGVYAERGPSHALRGKGPAFVPMPMASAYATAFGTLAVLVALYARRRTGRGEQIEVPLYNALLEGLSYNHLKLHGLPDRYMDWRGADTKARAAAGLTGPLPESRVQELIDPLYRSYRCADGRWYYLATPAHRRLVEGVLRHFGIWERAIADGLGTDDPYLSSRRWTSREDGSIFGLPRLSGTWAARLRQELTEAFAKKSGAEIEAELASAGLCGALVRSSQEWLEDPHAQASGLIRAHRASREPGPFAWIRQTGNDSAQLPVATGAHGLPLSGLTVLDLANVIAGPTVAGTLARFGARVIKIDDVRPGFDPFITVVLGLQAGRGKESLLLDLRSDEGRRVFEALARKADLVTYNGTDRQLSELGLDLDRLSALNPRLSVIQVGAFGGPATGPMTTYRGVDEVLQAATGVMSRMTLPGVPPEEFAHFGTIDVLTGICGSIAAMAALLVRDRTGSGSWAASSLAAGGALVQLPFMVRSADGTMATADHHPDGLGESATYRIYAVRDGWAFVAAPDRSERDLATALGVPAPLEEGIATLTADALRRRLEPAGIAVHALDDYATLRARHLVDETAIARALAERSVAFVRHAGHPLGYPVDLVAQCAIRFSSTPLRQPAPHPKYGSSTQMILAEAGVAADDIARLIADGVAAEQWPLHDMYLPD